MTAREALRAFTDVVRKYRDIRDFSNVAVEHGAAELELEAAIAAARSFLATPERDAAADERARIVSNLHAWASVQRGVAVAKCAAGAPCSADEHNQVSLFADHVARVIASVREVKLSDHVTLPDDPIGQQQKAIVAFLRSEASACDAEAVMADAMGNVDAASALRIRANAHLNSAALIERGEHHVKGTTR